MEIRLEDAVAIVTFEDHRVYFCSETCHEAFLDMPHSFVGWPEDSRRRQGHGRHRLDLRRLLSGVHPVR
jgi:YHS domain-containing protein